MARTRNIPAKTPIAMPALVAVSLDPDELLDAADWVADAAEALIELAAVSPATVDDSRELEAAGVSVAMANAPESSVPDGVDAVDAMMAVGNESSSLLLVAVTLSDVLSAVSLVEVSFALCSAGVVVSSSFDGVDVAVVAASFVDVDRSSVVNAPPAQPSGVSVL